MCEPPILCGNVLWRQLVSLMADKGEVSGAEYRLYLDQGRSPTRFRELPTGEPAADVVWVEFQVLADTLEREYPVPVLCPKPVVRLAKQSSPPRAADMAVAKPARHRILQRCEQKTPRATPVSGGMMCESKELLWNEHVVE
jgi:hypothetical protein